MPINSCFEKLRYESISRALDNLICHDGISINNIDNNVNAFYITRGHKLVSTIKIRSYYAKCVKGVCKNVHGILISMLVMQQVLQKLVSRHIFAHIFWYL